MTNTRSKHVACVDGIRLSIFNKYVRTQQNGILKFINKYDGNAWPPI